MIKNKITDITRMKMKLIMICLMVPPILTTDQEDSVNAYDLVSVAVVGVIDKPVG